VIDVLATDYPLLDVFWTMLWFFLFFLWIWLLVMIFGDIFRSHDLSGGAKALWVVFVIFLPFLGVLLYLIFRGGKMQERNVRQAQQDDAAFRGYVRDAAGTTSTADELTRLAALRDQGVITDAEFQQQKVALLGSS
jgi:ABC-type multidrug transport system fused ATPase/permease subunit